LSFPRKRESRVSRENGNPVVLSWFSAPRRGVLGSRCLLNTCREKFRGSDGSVGFSRILLEIDLEEKQIEIENKILSEVVKEWFGINYTTH
jgi:hypothetical protein